MTIDDIKKLIAKDETRTLELKKTQANSIRVWRLHVLSLIPMEDG